VSEIAGAEETVVGEERLRRGVPLVTAKHARPPHQDFTIRGKAQANCGIDLAVRVQAVISLAEMSDRLNVMCLFDEKTRKVTDGSGKEIKPLSYGWTELS
jgi:hypothetical protein